MPKIEKDLLKVKGSDGQWHYVPAVGGSVDTAPTWDAVQNKPFSTLGDGLEVDENGVLSTEGGSGSDNAVQYVAQSLTDEQKAQARENIGAGTSSFSGSYNDLTSKPTIPTQVTIDSTLKQSGQAADAKAVGDALQHFTPTEALNSEFREIELTFATKLDKNQGATNAGKILGIGEDGIVVPQDKPTYTLPQATADALGGIKADAATAEDTQDVRMGADGKLRTKPTGGSSVTVDSELSSASVNPVQNKVVTAALAEKITAPTTAAVGQIIKVKSVDTSGKPTEWEAADLSSGGGEDWTLLAEQTTTEIVREISFTLPKSVKHVVSKIWCPATGAEAVNRYINVKVGASYLFYYIAPSIPDKSQTSQLTVSADSIGGGYWRLSYYANRAGKAFDLFDGNNQNESVAVGVAKATYTEANTFAIMTVAKDTTQQFPAGTILKVWGF